VEVETALVAAVIVLESGGSTSLAERTFNNILKAYSKNDAARARVAPVWRSDFVAVSVSPIGSPSSTILRSLGVLGFSLFRASEAALLGERAARGEVERAAIASEVDRIKALASPHNRWIIILAAACAAAFFTQTASGDYGAFTVALVAAATGQFVRSSGPVRKLNRAMNISIAAIISALIGAAGLRLGIAHGETATLLGSIIYMVPGLSLANGFVDFVSDGLMLVGVERLLHAGFTFLILTLAVVVAAAVLLT